MTKNKLTEKAKKFIKENPECINSFVDVIDILNSPPMKRVRDESVVDPNDLGHAVCRKKDYCTNAPCNYMKDWLKGKERRKRKNANSNSCGVN